MVISWLVLLSEKENMVKHFFHTQNLKFILRNVYYFVYIVLHKCFKNL